MHFQGERVDSFYDLRGYLPDAHFENRSIKVDASGDFALCPKIFKPCPSQCDEVAAGLGPICREV